MKEFVFVTNEKLISLHAKGYLHAVKQYHLSFDDFIFFYENDINKLKLKNKIVQYEVDNKIYEIEYSKLVAITMLLFVDFLKHDNKKDHIANKTNIFKRFVDEQFKYSFSIFTNRLDGLNVDLILANSKLIKFESVHDKILKTISFKNC